MTILHFSDIQNLGGEEPEEEFEVESTGSDQVDVKKMGTGVLWAVRFLLPVGIVVCFLWVVLGVLLSGATALVWCFSPVKQTVRSALSRLWHLSCLGAATLLSAFVGLFSMRFGVTILCTYLLIHADEGAGTELLGFLRSRAQSAFYRF